MVKFMVRWHERGRNLGLFKDFRRIGHSAKRINAVTSAAAAFRPLGPALYGQFTMYAKPGKYLEANW